MQLKGVELIYMVASPPCRAVLMCLKELKLEVEMKKIDMFQKAEHKQPWFVKMNPQHCVPTLNDNGFILWESRAIMAYLINKYGSEEDRERLLPSDPEARAKVDWMWYFDIGCLYKSISDYYLPQLMSGESPEHQKANALKQNLDYLEIYLEETPYVSGETLTAADLSVLASVTHLESVDFRYEGYANVAAWAKKLKAELPYYNACNKEGIETFQKWAKTRLAVKKTK